MTDELHVSITIEGAKTGIYLLVKHKDIERFREHPELFLQAFARPAFARLFNDYDAEQGKRTTEPVTP